MYTSIRSLNYLPFNRRIRDILGAGETFVTLERQTCEILLHRVMQKFYFLKVSKVTHEEEQRLLVGKTVLRLFLHSFIKRINLNVVIFHRL